MGLTKVTDGMLKEKYVKKMGDTMSGSLAMQGYQIIEADMGTIQERDTFIRYTMPFPFFTEGIANEKCKLKLPVATYVCELKVRVGGAWSHGDVSGQIEKSFNIYLGADGRINTQTASYTNVEGAARNGLAIGDIAWNSAEGVFEIVFAKTSPAYNFYDTTIILEFEGPEIPTISEIKQITFGSIYTTDTTVYPVPKLQTRGKDIATTDVATTTTSGLMSSADKTKLDGVASGANNYVHPTTHSPSIIAQDASNRFVSDTEKSNWNAKASTAVATTSANGLMASADKAKLDGIAAGANNYTHPSGDGNLHVPVNGTANNGRVLKSGSTAGSLSWGTLTAIDVGAAPVVHSHDMADIATGYLQTTRLTEPAYLTGGVTPTVKSALDATRADRTAFLQADQIIIEQSIDAGVTWMDAGYSDESKMSLFTGARPSISIPLLNGVKSCNCMMRITITGMKYDVPEGTPETEKYNYWNQDYVLATERYFAPEGSWMWVSSNSDKIYCEISTSTGADPEWVVYNAGFMYGWSGGNQIAHAGSFGGGVTQVTNGWNRRFTFRTCSPTNTFNDEDLTKGDGYEDDRQIIQHIKTWGSKCYSYSNNMMYNDHLYSCDINQNASFPGNVDGTQLISKAVVGTAPLVVNSNSRVDNLNVQYLNGKESVYFASTAVATTSANGLMASADKAKLDGIASGANNYIHPTTHPPSIIAQDASNRFVSDSEKSTWNGKANKANGANEITDSSAYSNLGTAANATQKTINAAINSKITDLTIPIGGSLDITKSDGTIYPAIEAFEDGMILDSTDGDLFVGGSSTRDLYLGGNTTYATNLVLQGDITSSGGFNQGSWNTPKSGMITQITDNSGAQHSVIVALKSDGVTRSYGMDILDSDTNLQMRLYAGNDYLEINDTAGGIVGSGHIRATGMLKGNGARVLLKSEYVCSYMEVGQAKDISIPTNCVVTKIEFNWSDYDAGTSQMNGYHFDTTTVSEGKVYTRISGTTTTYDILTSGVYDSTYLLTGNSPESGGGVSEVEIVNKGLTLKVNYSTDKLELDGITQNSSNGNYDDIVLNSVNIYGYYTS